MYNVLDNMARENIQHCVIFPSLQDLVLNLPSEYNIFFRGLYGWMATPQHKAIQTSKNKFTIFFLNFQHPRLAIAKFLHFFTFFNMFFSYLL